MGKSVIYLLIAVCICAALHAQPGEMPIAKISSSESPADIIKKNIFIKVSVSKTDVYVGEPVVITYYFWSAVSAETRPRKQPSFEGCSIMELTHDAEPSVQMLDGKKFSVTVTRRVLLTPLQEGDITPGVAEFDNILPIEHTDGLGFENYAGSVSSEPYTIHVKPLPLENKPADFSNAVGNFSISAAADNAAAHAGEIVTLKIKLEGSGNFDAVNIPVIQWPQGLEHFESSDSQYISQVNYPGKGVKIFEYSFMANKECSITIPPVSFSFFNPDKKIYTTLFTQPVAIAFTKAVTKKDWWKNVITEDITNRKYLWLIPAIALAVITVVYGGRHFNKKRLQQDAQEKEKKIKEAAAARASVIKQNEIREVFISLHELGDITATKKFSESARNILVKTLQLKLNSNLRSEYELLNMLSQNNAADAEACQTIFTTCDSILYTPAGDEPDREEIYFQLTSAVKKLLDVS
ncbi:MAG TPA: BatD family protein [Chitinophagaceae bacterium]|nr:BatD family protein [Chitinophagaceae bacterium]